MLKSILLSGLMLAFFQACSSTTERDIPLSSPSGEADNNSDNIPVSSPLPPLTPDTGVQPVLFSPNDVSILFPGPETQSDMDKVIRLTDFDNNRVLPQNLFDQTMRLVTQETTLTTPGGPIPVNVGAIQTRNGQTIQIGVADSISRSDWVISGIRIDPGAPGLTQEVFDVFGKSPQIRLVLQPVQNMNGTITVTDASLHLVFAFHGPKDTSNICRLHNVPDMDGFSRAVMDLKGIKDQFAAAPHNINTDGVALNVHPAFASAGAEFTQALKDYLNTHLTTNRLFAVSMAGIPQRAPEPWVFVALQKNQQTGNIEPVPSPAIDQSGPLPKFGQMLSFLPPRGVFPAAATRNRQPIDCRMNFGLPSQPEPTAGLSTTLLFANQANNTAEVGLVVSDPKASHFFNTDCVSCHTETRRELDAGTSALSIGTQADIDPAVLPNSIWNVRAFGWFPPVTFAGTTTLHETITRRTATETEEVVECFHTTKWKSMTESCLP